MLDMIGSVMTVHLWVETTFQYLSATQINSALSLYGMVKWVSAYTE